MIRQRDIIFMNKDFHHAYLLQRFRHSGATVEDLARAWASMEGKLSTFEAEKRMGENALATHGSYWGYLFEVEELLRRATEYALARREAEKFER